MRTEAWRAPGRGDVRDRRRRRADRAEASRLASTLAGLLDRPDAAARLLRDEEDAGRLDPAGREQLFWWAAERLGLDRAEALFDPVPGGTQAARSAQDVRERIARAGVVRVQDRNTVRAARTATQADGLRAQLGIPHAVTIRLDEQAARRAGARSATGVVEGGEVFLHPARFDPGTRHGRHVLAHELAHVAQLGRPGGAERSYVEAEADGIARSWATGGRAWAPALGLATGAVAADTDAKKKRSSQKIVHFDPKAPPLKRLGQANKNDREFYDEFRSWFARADAQEKKNRFDAAAFRALYDAYKASSEGRRLERKWKPWLAHERSGTSLWAKVQFGGAVKLQYPSAYIRELLRDNGFFPDTTFSVFEAVPALLTAYLSKSKRKTAEAFLRHLGDEFHRTKLTPALARLRWQVHSGTWKPPKSVTKKHPWAAKIGDPLDIKTIFRAQQMTLQRYRDLLDKYPAVRAKLDGYLSKHFQDPEDAKKLTRDLGPKHVIINRLSKKCYVPGFGVKTVAELDRAAKGIEKLAITTMKVCEWGVTLATGGGSRWVAFLVTSDTVLDIFGDYSSKKTQRKLARARQLLGPLKILASRKEAFRQLAKNPTRAGKMLIYARTFKNTADEVVNALELELKLASQQDAKKYRSALRLVGAIKKVSGLINALDGGLTAGQRKVEPVQQRSSGAGTELDAAGVSGTAAAGLVGGGAPLPHLGRIQRAFGDHDLSSVRAFVGGRAAEAAERIGAQAYASGERVAFAAAPDLRTAAHEAAHVVQQRAGLSLPGGVGREGDAWERSADAVADRVVAGESATDLLGSAPARSLDPAPGSVQRRRKKKKKKKPDVRAGRAALKLNQRPGSTVKGRFAVLDRAARFWATKRSAVQAMAKTLDALRDADPKDARARTQRDGLKTIGQAVVESLGKAAVAMHKDWLTTLGSDPARRQATADVLIQCEVQFHKEWAQLMTDVIRTATKTGLFDDLPQSLMRSHAVLFNPRMVSRVMWKVAKFNEPLVAALKQFLRGKTRDGQRRGTKLFPKCTHVHVDLSAKILYALLRVEQPTGKDGKKSKPKWVAVKMPCKVPGDPATIQRLVKLYGGRAGGKKPKAWIKSSHSSIMSKKFNAGTGWLGIGGKGKQRWYNRKDRQTYRIPSDKGNIYGPTLHTIHTPSYRPKKKGDTPGERLHGAPGDLELKPEEAIKQVTTKGQREVPWDKNKPRDENEVQGCVYLPPRDAIWVQQVITITGGRTWVTMEKGGPSFKADQTVTDYTSL